MTYFQSCPLSEACYWYAAARLELQMWFWRHFSN